MKIKKRILSIALAGALTLGLLPALPSPALAADADTTYTITIPSTLTVADKGWNATDGISATGSLVSGKKLTVTASSANCWALKSGDNSVGYNLATATGTYSSTAQPASWEFTELSSTATKKDMGIIVEDYSKKPAGTYQDTVTFTAKVENAVTTRTVTWDSSVINDISLFEVNKSYTNSGITVTMTAMEAGSFSGGKMSSGGAAAFAFTTTKGKIAGITINGRIRMVNDSNWNTTAGSITWSGTPASSVTLSSAPISIRNIASIVFTIEE